MFFRKFNGHLSEITPFDGFEGMRVAAAKGSQLK